MKANIYVGTRDIASQLESLEGEVVSLNSMIDLAELKEKMRAVLIKMNLL
ncbi:MAG TPA: PTS ascorbate transporter subunit IIB [Firmicutes bacterium]|jgi:PTS system ascorbate-specific IIB component|nr:PTS ascorbate transporter subunit IIB [Bacillota bacterium]